MKMHGDEVGKNGEREKYFVVVSPNVGDAVVVHLLRAPYECGRWKKVSFGCAEPTTVCFETCCPLLIA